MQAMGHPINHNETIFESFLNGPDSFTRYEDHDLEYLSNLLANEKTLKSDKILLRNSIKIGETISETNEDGKTKSIPYKYEKLSGRYSTKLGLFGLSKELKNDLFIKHEGYQSLDIVNRNYQIINEICKINGLNFPEIETLVKNYKTFSHRYSYYWGGSELSKKAFSQLVYHPEHKSEEPEYIKNLVDELQKVHTIFNHPGYPDLTLMQMIEIYSTYIINNCVYEYLVQHEIIKNEHCCLGNNVIYFKPLKSFDKKDVETYIHEQTGLNIILH